LIHSYVSEAIALPEIFCYAGIQGASCALQKRKPLPVDRLEGFCVCGIPGYQIRGWHFVPAALNSFLAGAAHIAPMDMVK